MSNRNYKAMGDEKLLRVAREGVPPEDAEKVASILASRNISVPERALAVVEHEAPQFVLTPMLAEEADTVPEGDEWRMEQKIDGWRFLFLRDEGRVRSFAGRNSSEKTGSLPALEGHLNDILPNGTVIDGELIGRETGVAVASAIAHQLPVEFVVFDVLYVDGQDVRPLPFRQRRELIEQIDFDGLNAWRSVVAPARHSDYELLVKAGAEGVVAKRLEAPYFAGRSRSWIKVKAKATLEAEVIGFEPGSGSWAEYLGAMTIRCENGTQTTVRMKNDEMRDQVTANPAAYRGRILEITHNGLGKSGVPRHPRFLRWREDKEAI
jgi:bifunctional non-homologous end joining protein LigD